MARLQRKKTGNKKKKRKNGDGDEPVQSVEAAPGKKTLSFTGFSMGASKKQTSQKKKATGGNKALKVKENKNFIEKTLQFLREVRIEFRKVTWPTKKITIGSTIVVIILCVIISLFLGLVDFTLSKLVLLILH